jgi:anti-sigma regulatory factor (Ser/Thr protein kinase)
MVDATSQSHPEGSCYASVTVPSRVESIRLATAFIVQAARNMHVPPASDALFESAIVEALNNAVKHGNAAQRPGATIVCELELVDHRLTVRILDQGPGFVLPQTRRRAFENPLGRDVVVPRPEWSAENLTTIPESGFGISIIQGVFPMVRTIARPGEFGLEMALTF